MSERNYTYAKPSLQYDEQWVTGPVRVELYGDADVARRAIQQGRKTLGMLREAYGIPQMQAIGQPTGFRHLKRTLNDGTVVHATHNEGQEIVRIISPEKVPKEEKKRRPELELDDFNYLWVGIRNTYSPESPYYSCQAILAEPDWTPDEGVYYRGYVGTSSQPFGMSLAFAYTLDPEDNTYSFTREHAPGWDTSQSGTIEEMLQEMVDAWDFSSGGRALFGHHHLYFDISGVDSQGNDTYDMVTGSFNGLMCVDGSMYSSDPGFVQQGMIPPYDPLRGPEFNNGEERDVSGRTGFNPPSQVFGWDIVYWLDPFDYQRIRPVDDRALVLGFTRFMRSDDSGPLWPSGLRQVIPGMYKLGVMAYDTMAVMESSRGGQEITTIPPEWNENGNPFFRSGDCDYEDYLSTPDQPPPKYEVEIRIGKNYLLDDGTFVPLGTRRFIFSDNVEDAFSGALSPQVYDDRFYSNSIFGMDNFDQCTQEGGPNPAGPNFADWVGIDVRQGTVTLGVEPPTPGIGGGTWTYVQNDVRVPVGIYVYGGIFPQPTDGSGPGQWEQLAGEAVFHAVEVMTSGVYGCSIMRDFTQAEITAAFAGTTHAKIWKYDPVSCSVSEVPIVSSVGDYDYSGPLSENFYWYYPYFVQHYLACQNGMGILVSSVGGFYEGSQNPTDLADPIDCC